MIRLRLLAPHAGHSSPAHTLAGPDVTLRKDRSARVTVARLAALRSLVDSPVVWLASGKAKGF